MRTIRCILLLATSCIFSTSATVIAFSDVIQIEEKHLSVNHWIQQLPDETASKSLLSAAAITQFNQQLIANNKDMFDPLATKHPMTGDTVKSIIQAISTPSKYDRFYADGRKLTDSDYQHYLSNVAISDIPNNVAVSFALVTRRTPLRMLPTLDRVFNKDMDTDLDRFQETAVFPGDALAVLHQSKDKKWYFVRHYHYQAWVQAKDIAIGNREEIRNYKNTKRSVVITAAKALTNFNPDLPATSETQLEMGSSFPLFSNLQVQHKLHGQNPYASRIIQLPTRKADGGLAFEAALLARQYQANIGFLDLTPAALLQQSFKFLGERYGWGHDFNGRDCTGFVGEIYKSFGLIMPRNSGQQGYGEYGTNFRFKPEQKKELDNFLADQLQVGDLIYIPGHVMMFIGYDAGQPFVIHDVKGLSYYQGNEYYQGTLNGVSVTPLLPLHLNQKKSFVDAIYNIKRIQS